MAYRWKNNLTKADVTPKGVWLNRRAVLAGMGCVFRPGDDQEMKEVTPWSL
jgi:sulfoxide reductase catalytic subunit YedY